jgi:hypothetical protein
MNTVEHKMSGLNLWFIIEILSFYGYIVSAVIFIFEQSLMSSLGYINKESVKERFKFDFLQYHIQDCNWIAFVTILSMVNVCLMLLERTSF